MKFLLSCILNILGIGIIVCNFNISYSDMGDYLAMVVMAILLNTAGAINNN